MLALALILLAQTPAPVEQALRDAAGPSVRLELRRWSQRQRCEPTHAEVRGPVAASGSIPVRVTGPACEAWAWAQVALFAPALVVELEAGEGQSVSAVPHERELTAGRTFLTALPPSSVAARRLPRGTVLEPRHLRLAGPAVGEEIVVVASSGALSIAQRARVIGCRDGRSCAQLANGRRVEGTVIDGRLRVELR